MDHSTNTTPRSVPTPQSPAPLALSEFMAQAAPCSDTSPSSGSFEKSRPSSDLKKMEAVEDPQQALVQGKPRTPTSQQLPEDKQTPPSTEEDESPPPTDWLATRQQLLPRRNQGKKADWIRGWSQAVSSHGDSAYCACSETIDTTLSRGRKSKSIDLTVNVRAILQRTASPSSRTKTPVTTITPSEPEVCPNCSRPPSPPPSTTPDRSSSLVSETSHFLGTRSLGKRFSELFMRVRPSRSKSAAHKRDAEIRKMAWPAECQPRWATTGQGEKRLLVRPLSQPVSAPTPVNGGMEKRSRPGMGAMRVGSYFGGLGSRRHSRGRISTNPVGAAAAERSSSDLDGTSDSDAPRRPGLARSMSRLQRAAALLQRATTKSKD